MRFILNKGLTETQSRSPYDPTKPFVNFESEIVSDIVGRDDWETARQSTLAFLKYPDMDGVVDTQEGYLQLLSSAYSLHRKIVLHPHDVWFIIVGEFAALVAANQNVCRPLFTTSPEKIIIAVPTDDFTRIDLNLIEGELRRRVPMDMSQFLPEFSTITQQARYAMLAFFCESASHYYGYMTFACGIPEIKIEGTVNDWELLKRHAVQLASTFADVGLDLRAWMDRVCTATDNIIAALTTGNPKTLQNIFTQGRIGSGSQLKIDGWFADFYRKDMRGKQLEGFPNMWAKVPYQNAETGREFVGIHGCFTARHDADGFIQGDYGEMIVERVSKAEAPTSPTFKIERIEVNATSRVLDKKWALLLAPTEDEDPIFEQKLIQQIEENLSDALSDKTEK